MAKAYSYIRFSTPEQSKGDSLRRQSELSEEYAKKNNLELDTSLKLTDLGVSAYDKSNITKGALGIFLQLVNEGQIEKGSYLLVESLDRLSRAQVFDAFNLFSSIISAGITIVTLKDNIVYNEVAINKNWTNLIYSLTIMSRAAEESSTKSFRGRAAWDSKRDNISKKRLTARCPYWLKPSDGETGFELIPERAKIVKKIFKMAKDGMGNHTITMRLNQKKVPAFSSKTDGWHTSYIQKLLRNKAVYGEFQMNIQRDGEIKAVKEPIDGYYPAVLSKEEWTLVNTLRASRTTSGGKKKGKHLSNLFSGLLKCGYCGSSMTMGGYAKPHKRGTGKKPKFVACSKARRGLGCKYSSWNYDELEAEILQFCHSIDFAKALGETSTLANEVEAAKKNVINLDSQLSTLENKLSSLLNAIEDSTTDEAPKTIISRVIELEDQKLELEKERNELEKKVSALESNLSTFTNQHNAIQETIKKLNTLDGTELHDLRIRLSSQISHAIERIALYPYGHYETDENKAMIKRNLKEAGYTTCQIKDYYSELEQMSGKKHRRLTVLFHNGKVLSITKNYLSNIHQRVPKEGFEGFESLERLESDFWDNLIKNPPNQD